jgi:flagellar biosynthesis protein FlhF
MQLHTYRARSLSDALRLVREELGPDASVLHTREVGGTVARWLLGRQIEVTASAEVEVPSRLPVFSPQPEASSPKSLIPGAELLDYRGQYRAALGALADSESSLIEQLAIPARAIARPWTLELGSGTTVPRGPAPGLASRLQSAGASEQAIRRWLQRLDAELACDPECHADRVLDRLRHIIASELPVRGPLTLQSGQPTVVVLVGPTGVGKTTTLAKLAAHFCVRQERSVGLVTVDTYRIAAVDQLRAYAEILSVPMEVVASPRDMGIAAERLSHCDLILVDTPGRSPQDDVRLRELRSIVAAANPDEVTLVLSAVTDDQRLQAAARSFAAVGPSSLILTKLDEAGPLGQLPDWLAACRLPLSYLTDGQNVPDDIRPASALQIAELITA